MESLRSFSIILVSVTFFYDLSLILISKISKLRNFNTRFSHTSSCPPQLLLLKAKFDHQSKSDVFSAF